MRTQRVPRRWLRNSPHDFFVTLNRMSGWLITVWTQNPWRAPGVNRWWGSMRLSHTPPEAGQLFGVAERNHDTWHDWWIVHDGVSYPKNQHSVVVVFSFHEPMGVSTIPQIGGAGFRWPINRLKIEANRGFPHPNMTHGASMFPYITGWLMCKCW